MLLVWVAALLWAPPVNDEPAPAPAVVATAQQANPAALTANGRPLAVVGECDPKPGENRPRPKWTKEQRQEVSRRIRVACEHLQASPVVCAFYASVLWRESSGRAGVRHTKGENENGLGPLGLSLRWHRDKWPGKDEDPAWCTPEASLVTAHEIVWRAFTRYNAENMLDAQAIFGPFKKYCYADPNNGRRRCYADPDYRTKRSICGRMGARGFSCHAKVTLKDLGVRVPKKERRAWVENLLGHPLPSR